MRASFALGSRVEITASSNVHPIHVRIDEIGGHVDLDVVDGRVTAIHEARIAVDVERLRSGNPIVDRETRRRIDARRHPRIVGRLSSAESIGDGRFRLSGEIEFHGTTRPVEGVVTTSVVDGAVAIAGHQVFDVRTWGLEPPRILVLRVEPEVTVQLHARAGLP